MEQETQSRKENREDVKHPSLVALLPCPFCGKTPVVKKLRAMNIGEYKPQRSHYYIVTCEICVDTEQAYGCGIYRDGWTEEQAVERWNTRA